MATTDTFTVHFLRAYVEHNLPGATPVVAFIGGFETALEVALTYPEFARRFLDDLTTALGVRATVDAAAKDFVEMAIETKQAYEVA